MHVGAVSYLSLLLTGILLLPISVLAQSLEKVRIVYARRGLRFFSAFVSREMNFYQSNSYAQVLSIRRGLQ